jgi:hypothetical protein
MPRHPVAARPDHAARRHGVAHGLFQRVGAEHEPRREGARRRMVAVPVAATARRRGAAVRLLTRLAAQQAA